MRRSVLEVLIDDTEIDEPVKELIRTLQVFNTNDLITIKDYVDLLIIMRKTKEED